jgi:hypothetical protein
MAAGVSAMAGATRQNTPVIAPIRLLMIFSSSSNGTRLIHVPAGA